ncbi:MAG TPA: hypothetical protein VF283_13425 [Bryobacteraceae bacterium]
MKHFQRFAALTVIAALAGTGVPAMAQGRYDVHNRGQVQYASRGHRDSHDWNNNRNRNDRRDVRYNPDRNRGYRDYYDQRSHNGRTAAIIGGSAAAGALIGAVAGHGQGAIIGAVIGGIVGVAASSAADQHHRY